MRAGHDGRVETRDDDTTEEAMPAWLLRTPTRRREVWPHPVLVVLLAAAHVVLGIVAGGVLALVVGVSAAAVTAAGAVALFVTGWRAYDEQTRDAAWRCHVARVVIVVPIAAVVAIESSLVGGRFGLLFVVCSTAAFSLARDVPRIDHLVVAWALVAVSVCCAALAVVGSTVDDLPDHRAAAWTAGGVVALFAAPVAVHQFRAARRAPSW